MQEVALHWPQVNIIGTHNCDNTCQEAVKLHSDYQNVLCHQDYAERVVAIFAYQIQSGYYGGNKSVFIEGIIL